MATGGVFSVHIGLAGVKMRCESHRREKRLQAMCCGLAAGLACACIGPSAVGLEPSHRLTQYGHMVWRIQDGVFSGAPSAFAQTADGYIWIGTQSGLLRFDGVNFTPFRPSPKERLRSPNISSLLAARDGSLWVGTSAYLAHFKDGDLTNYLDVIGEVSQISESRKGDIWFSRRKTPDGAGALCRVAGARIACYGNAEGIPYKLAGPLLEGDEDDWWIAAASEVAHWNRGSSTTYAPAGLKANHQLDGFTALAKNADGSVWAGMEFSGKGLGLQRFSGGKWNPILISGFDSSSLAVTALLFDRDHSLWIGTKDKGIYRLNGASLDHFGSSDGLSSDTVHSLFEDQEGNIWIATSKGIDKFRDFKVVTYSKAEGLRADQVDAVLASGDGTIWMSDGTLESIRGRTVTSMGPRDGLPGRDVTSLLEDRFGKLWIGVDDKLFVREEGKFQQITDTNGGPVGAVEKLANGLNGTVWARSVKLPHRLLHIVNGKVIEEVEAPDGMRQRAFAPEPDGELLVGLESGDLAEYQARQWKVIPLHRIKATWHVVQFATAADGGILGATSSGVLGWKRGRAQDLNADNDLPCNRVYSLIFDSQKTLWLYASCGLLSISDSELARWWQDPKAKLKYRIFNVLDGAQPAPPSYQPQTSMSPDGKLWFANGSVLQQIDPLHLPANNILPPVHIEEIVADTREYPLQNNLALPALTRELQINYTALSFAIPQRVQFRYKLDGLENEWQNVGTRRQAFFTNLRPGTYRFHVIACNDDGLWNSVGDTIGFTIAPAYYQTRWFALMCVAASGAILWALYLMRLKQATYQLQERLNARMEERERIARELHDTLLQGFQGLMLRFQAVVKMLPIEAVARQTMEQVLDRADEVLLEGRQSVRDLREEGTSATEMCEALRQCGEELAQNHTASFSLMIVGEPKAMATVVFNESYRIAREALVNAFQHSQGRNVEVEVTYLVSRVSIRVRDDGIGIDADILTKGRKGHWGLSGMRERAQKVAARLDIWSQAGSGTEIELTIPSTVAYPHDKRRSLRQRLYDMFIRFQRSRS